MGNKNEKIEYWKLEKKQEDLSKKMSRPHGKEIIEIEQKIMELIKIMDNLLMERYEIEKRKEEEVKQNHQQY